MYKFSTLDRIFCFITSLLLILSCGPFFIIGGHSTFVNVLVFAFYILIYMMIFRQRQQLAINVISRSTYNNFIISLFLFIFLFLPFRSHDTFVAVSIWAIVFLMILLLDNSYLKLSGLYFSNFIFYISFLVIFVWLLLFINISLPVWEFNTGLIGVSKSTYLIYPGTAVLNGQDFELFGRSVYRMSGIFSEPGHFGIFCFFSYLMAQKLSRFKRTVIILASLLSFSMGTYILWIGYIFIASDYTIKRKIGIILFVFLVSSALYTYLPMDVLDRFIFNKIDSGSTLDSRTDANFLTFYQSQHSLLNHLFGYGRLIFEEFDLSNSDYRGFYLKFGLLGVILYFVWVLSLAWNGHRENILLILLISIVIFTHRSWLIDYFIFYFTLLFLTKAKKNEKYI